MAEWNFNCEIIIPFINWSQTVFYGSFSEVRPLIQSRLTIQAIRSCWWLRWNGKWYWWNAVPTKGSHRDCSTSLQNHQGIKEKERIKIENNQTENMTKSQFRWSIHVDDSSCFFVYFIIVTRNVVLFFHWSIFSIVFNADSI